MNRAITADDSSFAPVALREEPVHDAARETARSGYRVFRGRGGFEVAVPEQVISRAVAFARTAAPREWYGLVVARLCEDEAGKHAVVLGIVPDPDARASEGTVETTPDSEYATRMCARTLYPDGIVVGWLHTHPRGGLAFSRTDKANQATWSQEHSLGLLVDPWHPHELAVYRGPRSERLELATDPLHTEETDAPPIRPSLRLRVTRAFRKHRFALSAALGIGAAVIVVCVQARQVRNCGTRIAKIEQALVEGRVLVNPAGSVAAAYATPSATSAATAKDASQ